MALRAGKNAKLDGGQRVEQPDLLWAAHQQEAHHHQRAAQVGPDQQVLAVVAVGGHPGDRADQEGSQHPHHEQPAHRQPGAGQHGDQGGRGDQVEPVAQQADDLPEPEEAEVAVVPDELAVIGETRPGGCGGGQWRLL
jgi:hypothetical protein